VNDDTKQTDPSFSGTGRDLILAKEDSFTWPPIRRSTSFIERLPGKLSVRPIAFPVLVSAGRVGNDDPLERPGATWLQSVAGMLKTYV
jgi:hypothetical protein